MDCRLHITVNPMTSAVTLSPRVARRLGLRSGDAGKAMMTMAYDKDRDLYLLLRLSDFAKKQMFGNVVAWNPVTRRFGFIMGGLHNQLTVAGLLDHYGITDMSARDIRVRYRRPSSHWPRLPYLVLGKEGRP